MSTLVFETSATRRSPALAATILAAYRAFRLARARRAAGRALSAMEDHMLKDLGISRSEIPLIVYGLRPAHGDHADEA